MTCLNTSYKILTGLLGNHTKDQANRNKIWDKSQLRTCSGIRDTIDPPLIDSAITDEVQEKKRNLSVSFYDYQKAYDMVRHDCMIRVFTWMGYPSKLINVLKQLMDRWKTKLEVNDGREIKTSRWIRILKSFLKGDSYLPVGFCLTAIPIAVLLDETEGYKLGQPRKRCIKRRYSLFIDNLKVY